jgi:hypothetical protein
MDDAMPSLSPIPVDALVAILKAVADQYRSHQGWPIVAGELEHAYGRIARRLREPIAVDATNCEGLMVPDLSNVVFLRRPR